MQGGSGRMQSPCIDRAWTPTMDDTRHVLKALRREQRDLWSRLASIAHVRAGYLRRMRATSTRCVRRVFRSRSSVRRAHLRSQPPLRRLVH